MPQGWQPVAHGVVAGDRREKVVGSRFALRLTGHQPAASETSDHLRHGDRNAIVAQLDAQRLQEAVDAVPDMLASQSCYWIAPALTCRSRGLSIG